jgi:hypothetical protein
MPYMAVGGGTCSGLSAEVTKGLLLGQHRRTSSDAPSDGDQDELEKVDSESTDSGITAS